MIGIHTKQELFDTLSFVNTSHYFLLILKFNNIELLNHKLISPNEFPLFSGTSTMMLIGNTIHENIHSQSVVNTTKSKVSNFFEN